MLRPRILNDTSCGSYFVVGTNFAIRSNQSRTLFGGVELDTVYSVMTSVATIWRAMSFAKYSREHNQFVVIQIHHRKLPRLQVC